MVLLLRFVVVVGLFCDLKEICMMCCVLVVFCIYVYFVVECVSVFVV